MCGSYSPLYMEPVSPDLPHISPDSRRCKWNMFCYLSTAETVDIGKRLRLDVSLGAGGHGTEYMSSFA